jgi:hypothetical protein
MDICALIGLLLGVGGLIKMCLIYTGADFERNNKEYQDYF